MNKNKDIYDFSVFNNYECEGQLSFNNDMEIVNKDLYMKQSKQSRKTTKHDKVSSIGKFKM